MKNMRKVVALVLSLMLTLTIVTTTLAEESTFEMIGELMAEDKWYSLQEASQMLGGKAELTVTFNDNEWVTATYGEATTSGYTKAIWPFARMVDGQIQIHQIVLDDLMVQIQ